MAERQNRLDDEAAGNSDVIEAWAAWSDAVHHEGVLRVNHSWDLVPCSDVLAVSRQWP